MLMNFHLIVVSSLDYPAGLLGDLTALFSDLDPLILWSIPAYN